MTRDRKLNATMWHTHIFGGTNGINNTYYNGSGSSQTMDPSYYSPEGAVTSFCVVPNPITGINDVWVVRKITLNQYGGPSQQANWSIERMMGKNVARNSCYSNVFPGVSGAEPFMVDCAVINDDNGDGTLVYSGCRSLDQFTGTGYPVVIGNYYSPTYGIFKQTAQFANSSDAAAGNITLLKPLSADYGQDGNFVVLGYPYTSIIVPVRIDSGSVIGSAQGAIKRINRCFVRFFKTMSAQMGSPPNYNNPLQNSKGLPNSEGGEQYPETNEHVNGLERVYFAGPRDWLSQSPELYTGDKKVNIPSTYDRNAYLWLQQSDPLPFTVISIISEGEEFD